MVPSLPPPVHTQPEREGLQGGMYRDPACSLKLNTDNSEDTSWCISTDMHDMHSKRDFRERVTPGSQLSQSKRRQN